MDRAKVKQLRAEIDAFLETLQSKHNMMFEIGTIRFTDTEMRCTLRGQERVASQRRGNSDPSNLYSLIGSTFKHKRSVFTIINYDPGKPKYAFTVKNQFGTVYQMKREGVLSLLAKQ